MLEHPVKAAKPANDKNNDARRYCFLAISSRFCISLTATKMSRWVIGCYDGLSRFMISIPTFPVVLVARKVRGTATDGTYVTHVTNGSHKSHESHWSHSCSRAAGCVTRGGSSTPNLCTSTMRK